MSQLTDTIKELSAAHKARFIAQASAAVYVAREAKPWRKAIGSEFITDDQISVRQDALAEQLERFQSAQVKFVNDLEFIHNMGEDFVWVGPSQAAPIIGVSLGDNPKDVEFLIAELTALIKLATGVKVDPFIERATTYTTERVQVQVESRDDDGTWYCEDIPALECRVCNQRGRDSTFEHGDVCHKCSPALVELLEMEIAEGISRGLPEGDTRRLVGILTDKWIKGYGDIR